MRNYKNSKYINTSVALNGRRLTSSGPKRLANLWMSYRISNGLIKALGLGAGGNYGSEIYAVNSNLPVHLPDPLQNFYAAIFYDSHATVLG